MSDDEDNSSNSSSSYDSSASSSPDAKRNVSSRNKKNFEDYSGSDSDIDLKDSSSLGTNLKEDNKETQGSGDDSSGSSDEDNEDPGNKSPSSSSESSDHEDDDDKENSQKEDEDGEDDARSLGSRCRSDSANGSHSKSDDSDSHGSETDIKKLWEMDPDFYGVRRSSRTKASPHPPKLYPQVINKKTVSRKIAKSSKKRKSLSEDDSSDEEVTRSTRKRTNMVSYKEQESEDEDDKMSVQDDVEDMEINGEAEDEEQVDTIEKIMDIRQGKVGATGSATTLYVVSERGDPNETLPTTEKETQFLIKWVGFSHLHNTWESLNTIQEKRAKGLKKLDNYCKREDELKRWKRFANPEDIEYYECQLELQQELAKSYTRAERIIAEHINAEGEVEYYVKWDCLPYADATWENGSLISSRNPDVIKIYKKREASNRTPASSAKVLKYRPKFSALKEQPDFMTGDTHDLILRDYQLDGLNWLVHSWCKENSVILADEMGLGKTIQTICFLSYLFETHNLYGPYLLVVPLSTMTAWQKEFGQWAPQINVVTYLGDVASRDIIREYEWYFKPSNKLKFNAILTTYEIVLKDKAFLNEIAWASLLVDEAHRLKNGDSLLYRTLQEFNTNHRLLITGTPLQNSLKELWSLLHFIMPHKFDEWETFESEHDDAATKGYSKLHKQLEPFILRRVKKDVEKSLPAKVEQILRVEMTSLQKQYYKWILTKNYNALRKGVKGSVSSFVNVVMELKKCCNHAMLVKPMENDANDSLTQLIKGSGKLMLLDKLLVRLKETGHRVLIFSQMVRMLDIIAEYLQQRRFSFQRLDGSIKGDLRKQALDHFNAEGSQDFCFLLSTRAGGLGINLATADTVIIFDSDWNPQNDLQAQARAHRIGQKNQVNIYRLVTKNSVEEDIVERAKQKMVLDHLVIQRMDTTGRTVLDKGSKAGQPFNKDELNAILKFGAEELFKEDANEGDDQCDIDEILRRAETHEDPGERPGDELLSAFKVASFSVNEDEEVAPAPQKDWDRIIPEDLRSKIEAEEKEKEMAGLYLPPRRAANNSEANGNTANNNDALRKIKAKRKRMRDNQSEEESESDDDGRPKKRGRPKSAREAKGFTDNQIRKFIKSFKRFPRPLSRIELIAKDCGLSDKSVQELRKLGEQLIQGCQAAMTDLKNPNAGPVHIKEEVPIEPLGGADGKKKREKGPLFKVAGINVNARTLSIALEELKPLGAIMPKEPEARKTWKFELKAKVPPYDVEWGAEEDTKLLLGIWEHGTGAWDIIRDSDPLLKEKIFPETEKEKKPQLKHAQSRAEYLLKVMKKHLALTQDAHPKKKREKKDIDGKSKDTVKDENRDKEDVGLKPGKAKRKSKGEKKDINHRHPDPNDELPGINAKMFSQCKEMMRPVKNALKSLDNPDATLSEKDQVRHTKNCLIEIGDQIQKCLEKYTNEAELKEWKSNLWIFVSHFTEYDANKLYKLYRKASKKVDDKDVPGKKPEKEKPKDSTKHHHYHKEKKDRHRDKDRESIRNFPENSNSSSALPGNHSRNSHPKLSTYERERERDKRRERFAQKMGELPSEPRVPQHPPIDDPNYDSPSAISPRKFHHGYPTNGPNYRVPPGPPGTEYYNSYRGNSGERSRERAPGDPRSDRSGAHASKNYRNERDGYDRNIPTGDRDRRSYTTPTPPPQRSRWGPGPEGYAGGPRRGAHSNYYGPNPTSPVVPPSHFNNAPSPVPYGGPASHHSGRIAPPLGSTDWRRGEGADADLGINQRHIDEDSHADPMDTGIDIGRRRRELY